MKRIKIFTERLQRGLRQLWHRDIWHFWPTAPLSWRYFLPGQSTAIRLHRKLWWHSRYKLPGLLWLPLELGRWLHWQLLGVNSQLDKAIASYCSDVAERFGVPVEDQRRRLAYWAKAWCIDPFTGYHWQLFRSDADGLSIVYDNQTSAFHAIQNKSTGATKADHRLLGDKITLAECLSAQGIPMVQTVCVTRGDWQDLEAALTRHPKLFCKLRSGNQGESAFAVWRAEHGLQGLAHDGKNLLDEHAVRQAWQQLTGKGVVLLQPLLTNHPLLAAAPTAEVAVTLRLVTRQIPDGACVWWAELQVPGEVSASGGQGFWRFPLSVHDGRISCLGGEWFVRQAWQNEYDMLWQRLSNAGQVPFWAQLVSDSLKAQQALPKVWAIAWDWVITPDGPVLLEGNGGWGLCEVQQQGNDLLAPALNGSQVVQ